MSKLEDRDRSHNVVPRAFLAIVLIGFAAAVMPVVASPVPGHTGAVTLRLAFVAGPSQAPRVYTVNGDGTGMRPVTRGDAESLSWSPDGKLLAFERLAATGKAYRRDVYMVRADGSGIQRRLFDAEDPLWAPDGQSLAFKRWNDHQARIWSVRADGSNARQLTQSDASDSDEGWSPDGKRIVFERDWVGPPSRVHVFVMNADGTGQRRLVRGRQTGRPAWSPDGRRMAFVGWIDHCLYVADDDGSGMRRLARDVKIMGSPLAWSPNGREILFTKPHPRSFGDLDDLYAISVDGDRMRLIAPLVSEGSWSHDSRTVLFWRDERQGNVYTVDADRHRTRRIATDVIDLRWSPDGRTVLFTRRDGIYRVNADGTGRRRLVRAQNPHSLAVLPLGKAS